MSVYGIIYAEAAQNDLRDIFRYIAYELQAEQAARGQVRRILDAIRQLDTMPDRHEAVDWEPWASMDMRKMPVDNFIVFYMVDRMHKNVIVVRVVYGGRNLEELF